MLGNRPRFIVQALRHNHLRQARQFLSGRVDEVLSAADPCHQGKQVSLACLFPALNHDFLLHQVLLQLQALTAPSTWQAGFSRDRKEVQAGAQLRMRRPERAAKGHCVRDDLLPENISIVAQCDCGVADAFTHPHDWLWLWIGSALQRKSVLGFEHRPCTLKAHLLKLVPACAPAPGAGGGHQEEGHRYPGSWHPA